MKNGMAALVLLLALGFIREIRCIQSRRGTLRKSVRRASTESREASLSTEYNGGGEVGADYFKDVTLGNDFDVPLDCSTVRPIRYQRYGHFVPSLESDSSSSGSRFNKVIKFKSGRMFDDSRSEVPVPQIDMYEAFRISEEGAFGGPGRSKWREIPEFQGHYKRQNDTTFKTLPPGVRVYNFPVFRFNRRYRIRLSTTTEEIVTLPLNVNPEHYPTVKVRPKYVPQERVKAFHDLNIRALISRTFAPRISIEDYSAFAPEVEGTEEEVTEKDWVVPTGVVVYSIKDYFRIEAWKKQLKATTQRYRRPTMRTTVFHYQKPDEGYHYVRQFGKGRQTAPQTHHDEPNEIDISKSKSIEQVHKLKEKYDSLERYRHPDTYREQRHSGRRNRGRYKSYRERLMERKRQEDEDEKLCKENAKFFDKLTPEEQEEYMKKGRPIHEVRAEIELEKAADTDYSREIPAKVRQRMLRRKKLSEKKKKVKDDYDDY